MADIPRHVHDTDLLRDWVDLGDSQENPYMRFMAYWVAFNMLYEPYKKIVEAEMHNKKGARTSLDRRAIELLFENESNLELYDPFASGDADFFSSVELFKLYDWEVRQVYNARKAIKNGDAVKLMKAVYTVRCNLVHGNKRIGDPTDIAFAETGAIIVRGHLETYGFIRNSK